MMREMRSYNKRQQDVLDLVTCRDIEPLFLRTIARSTPCLIDVSVRGSSAPVRKAAETKPQKSSKFSRESALTIAEEWHVFCKVVAPRNASSLPPLKIRV